MTPALLYLCLLAAPGDWRVTAYTAGYESTGKRPGSPGYGVTASGLRVHVGHCAADRSIPFGTVLRIAGLGRFVVTDRGGAVKGRHVDIYMPDPRKARAAGVKYRKVTVERRSKGR